LLITNVMEPRPLIGARSLPLINLRKSLVQGGREERMVERGKKGERERLSWQDYVFCIQRQRNESTLIRKEQTGGRGGGGKQKGWGAGGESAHLTFFPSRRSCAEYSRNFLSMARWHSKVPVDDSMISIALNVFLSQES
jgi:hypothetical protein